MSWRTPWKHVLPILLVALALFASSMPVLSAEADQAPPPAPAATPAPAAGAQAPATSANGTAAPSYNTLADLLENDASRKQLVDQLRDLARQPAAEGSTAATAATAPSATVPPESGEPSLSRSIADGARTFVSGVITDFSEAIDTFRTLGRGEGVRGVSMEQWLSALMSMAIVVGATLLAYAVFRGIASRAFGRIDRWVARHAQNEQAAWAATGATSADPVRAAREASDRRRRQHLTRVYRYLVAVVGALVVDVAAIALAGLAGYLVGTFGAGERTNMGVLESMFVNAFVAVEIAKALIRMVFATRYEHLRLIPMTDDIARYWNAWLCRLIALTGYGIMVVVPVIRAMFSPAIGQLFGLILMLGVYIYAVRVIWGNRALLRERLERRADASSTAFFSTLIRMLARVWHILAIGYFTVLLVVSQIAPESALPFMARATIQTIVAVGLGLAISAVLSLVLKRRIHLSDSLRQRLPMLETRINSYVPATLKSLRTLILIIVVLVVLDAWHVFNLQSWLTSDAGGKTISTVVHVGIILLFAALVWTVIASIIEHRLNTTPDRGAPSARERTLLSLFRNAALIVIITMTILIVLSQIGINIAPLIAGAGVVGLAIGFGAQKLVQDIITGIFIQIENGMNQNDVVEAAGVFGTVEKITIRSVGIRTLDGGYHLIPFSSVDTVVNHMRDFSYHLGEYTIAHREDVDDAMHHLDQAFQELKQDAVLAPEILEDMTIPGVTSLNERGFTIRVLIKTTPGMQWAVQRGYNRLVKKHFTAANIELPYPHTVVYFGQDKKGDAPAVNLHTAADRAGYPAGDAPPNGHTPRPLTRAKPASAEVLGNELDTVVNDEGEPKPA